MVGLVGEPRTVFDDDPSARFRLASAVTETLVRRDAHDELIPRLAEAVPTLENGGLRVVTDDFDAPDGRLVATFRLRDAKWQDGEPITAGDVRFAWQQDKTATAGTLERWTADRISDVQVIAAREVRVLYRNGERWDDYALGPHVLPAHRLAQATVEQRTAYAREPVHAGAFAIAAWLPGSITLSAYPQYVMGTPKIGRLEIHFFPTRAVALQALLRGDIDVAPWPVLEADLARTLDRFADGTRLLAYYVPTETGAMLRFGSDPKRFGDPLVRKAIELTVDRQSIVDDVFVGRARVPRTYLLPPQWAAAEDVPPARPDRDRARAMLAEAGFTKGQFGILERGGERMTATVDVVAGSPARIDVARRVPVTWPRSGSQSRFESAVGRSPSGRTQGQSIWRSRPRRRPTLSLLPSGGPACVDHGSTCSRALRRGLRIVSRSARSTLRWSGSGPRDFQPASVSELESMWPRRVCRDQPTPTASRFPGTLRVRFLAR